VSLRVLLTASRSRSRVLPVRSRHLPGSSRHQAVTWAVTASPLPLAESRVTHSPSVTNGGDDLTATSTIDQPTAALRPGRMRGLAFPTDPINRRDSAERETPHLNGTHEIPIDPALAGPTDDPAIVTNDGANRSPFVSLFFLSSSQKSVIGPPSLRREII